MPERTLESDREGPAPIGTELAGLIDSIDLPIVVVDGNGTIAGFSAAASTLLALTLGDVGRPLRGVGTLADAADLEELCAHVIGGEAACQREIRDSAGSWFLVRVAPYRRSDRYVAGAVLTLTNVTALHASVEQAIHEREYAKAIINTVSQPLVVLDGELRVRTANRAFYATFRVSRAETEGLPVDALGGGPIPRLRPLLEDVLASSAPFEGVEIEHDFPALGRRTMLFSACRLARTGDLGQPILLTIHDVTERKRAEEGLRESEQRARTLADEAQSANRVKDEFLATLSHELRTPLTAMLGWTRILRAKVLSDDAAERALETIERNVRAQTQLIEDLLDVSRILNGRLRLDGRRLELRAVAEAALETIRPAAEAKRIQLGAAMDREGCAVWGDFGRLQQVVWNLLSNAVRFTPAGGRVEIVLERTASHATLVVADTGKGISPEFLPHVFEPFSQAESSAARRHGGLGLGLGIVRHLVELHGGTVHAESGGEGRGATFAVTLPLMLESVPSGWGEPEEESTNESVHGAEAVLGLAKLDEVRVLVVEDDADIRTLLDVVLSRCHAEVRVSSGAGEALAIVKSWQPDVLLADIGLPGEDGYSLLEKVRALSPEGGRRIPAAALTAYARVEDRERALTAGYDAYLAKPIEPSELVRLVRRLAPSAPREAGPVTPLRPRPA